MINLQVDSLSATTLSFLQSTQQEISCVKLYKYRHLLKANKQCGLQIVRQMLQLCISKKYLGQYQQIHSLLSQALPSIPAYTNLRSQMILTSNKLRNQIEHNQSIGNYQQLANGYYQLAEFYFGFTMYKQAKEYYNKLFRLHTSVFNRETYFTNFAQAKLFTNSYDELNFFIVNELDNPKLIDINLCIIKDLKAIQSAKQQIFQNVLINNYTIQQILSNKVISYRDLGILYSIWVLVNKDRQYMKNRVKWSSQIQVLYLKNDFKGLLTKLNNIYEMQGKFHPLIDKIYGSCLKKIRERILRKYLSAFSSISLKEIQQQTSFSQGELKLFLKKNPHLPYLIDPISSSIIYYQKQISLHKESKVLCTLMKQKYLQEVRYLINKKINQGNQRF